MQLTIFLKTYVTVISLGLRHGIKYKNCMKTPSSSVQQSHYVTWFHHFTIILLPVTLLSTVRSSWNGALESRPSLVCCKQNVILAIYLHKVWTITIQTQKGSFMSLFEWTSSQQNKKEKKIHTKKTLQSEGSNFLDIYCSFYDR